MYKEQLVKKLNIKKDLIADMMPIMVLDEDYEMKPNFYGVRSAYFFSERGYLKAKKYTEQLATERKRIYKVTGSLGYNINSRSYPSLWIYLACCIYLKSKGYRDCSIAFILGKNRTTVVTVWERMEQYRNERIANAVIEATLTELRVA